MALRRSYTAYKHLMTQGGTLAGQPGHWQTVPTMKWAASGALLPVSYEHRKPIPAGWVLRGSGLHGPENTDVMKLALWNRLKQRRPQRECPSIEDMQEYYKMETSIVWWMLGCLCFMGPLNWWGKKYRMVHDHYPWMSKRLDGTRGPGAYVWFME